MPVKSLPSNPDRDYLDEQVNGLLAGFAERVSRVAQLIREFHPDYENASDSEIFNAEFALADAQLTVAKEHGFRSWARLTQVVDDPALQLPLSLPHHQRVESATFRRALGYLDGGDVPGLRALLLAHPGLVHQRCDFEGGNYFRNPTLLEFVAENPVRHGTLPANIIEIARTILEIGPDQDAKNEALLLVSTGSIPRECQVQPLLIDLLCEQGANPDTAIGPAALHGELGAVRDLIRHGARLTISVAAALGEEEEFHRPLPSASAQERHLAFAIASQYGRVEMVRSLLNMGESPDRYNPPGGHSHCTPLHQAAAGGYDELARLLVARDARLDLEDVLWRGTPADWAKHEGRAELAEFLRKGGEGARSLA